MSETLILMFHRVHEPRLKFYVENFVKYLEYLHNNFAIVLPLQNSETIKPKLVLTFDDAYYDFYHFLVSQVNSIFRILKYL